MFYSFNCWIGEKNDKIDRGLSQLKRRECNFNTPQIIF